MNGFGTRKLPHSNDQDLLCVWTTRSTPPLSFCQTKLQTHYWHIKLVILSFTFMCRAFTWTQWKPCFLMQFPRNLQSNATSDTKRRLQVCYAASRLKYFVEKSIILLNHKLMNVICTLTSRTGMPCVRLVWKHWTTFSCQSTLNPKIAWLSNPYLFSVLNTCNLSWMPFCTTRLKHWVPHAQFWLHS